MDKLRILIRPQREGRRAALVVFSREARKRPIDVSGGSKAEVHEKLAKVLADLEPEASLADFA